MTVAPLPVDESLRLMDLARYEVLDTAQEEAFDRVTRLASRLLGVPIAAINFIDGDRQWSKSGIGLGTDELPREQSFCAWTILSDQPTVIPDLSRDVRSVAHPSVVEEPHLRMYAGAPLRTPSGNRIGTLCVMDTVPHPLTPEDLTALQDLAATAMSELELRIQVRQAGRQLDAQRERSADLKRSMEHAQTLEAVSTLVDLPLEPDEVAVQAAALIGVAIHADWSGIVVYQDGRPSLRRAYASTTLPSALQQLDGPLNLAGQTLAETLGTLSDPLYLDRYADHPAALPQLVAAGLQSVSWVPLGRWADQSLLLVTVRTGSPRRRPWRESDRNLLEAAGRSVRASLHRRAALAVADRLARTDALTGALNRRAFDDDLQLRQATGEDFLMVMIDLDGFKRVNDREGHAQGDKVLKIFAGALAAEMPADSVYRLGGDEFGLLLAAGISVGEAEDGIDVALLAARQVAFGRIGGSVGMAQRSEATAGLDVVGLADRRMYEAKRRRQQRRAELLIID